MARPPLRDVAARAGVSEPTVSRVLNGRPGVAESTRRRVADVLAEMGHLAPDVSAAATQRAVVGVVCGEFDNPVFSAFTHHIARRLGRAGYLTTVTVEDPDLHPEERCIAELVESRVSAIVLIGGRHARVDGGTAHYLACRDQGTPVVLVNGRGLDIDVPQVRCDEEIGSYRATRYLLGLGHRRIGLVLGGSEYIPTVRFREGHRKAMEEFGFAADPDAVVETSFTIEGGRAGGRALVQKGVTAVVAGNDLMALGALHAAGDAGLDVPTEFSAIGYDGTEITAFTRPALTTLRQPFEDMARHISDAVLSEISGSDRYRRPFVFEPQLLARDTTGAFGEPAFS